MILDWPIYISLTVDFSWSWTADDPVKTEKYAIVVEGWPKKLRKLLEHVKSISL